MKITKKQLLKLIREQKEVEGTSDITMKHSLADHLGEVIPWFIDANPVLHDFWDTEHAYWEIKVLRKGKSIYLQSKDKKKTIELKLTAKKV